MHFQPTSPLIPILLGKEKDVRYSIDTAIRFWPVFRRSLGWEQCWNLIFFFKCFKIVQAFLFLCLFVNFWNLKSIPINFIGFKVQGIPACCDFTIHDFTIYDPHDFVSGLNFLNSPLFHDFEQKLKKIFFRFSFGLFFQTVIFFYILFLLFSRIFVLFFFL